MGSDLKYEDAAVVRQRAEYARSREASAVKAPDRNTWKLRAEAAETELALRAKAGTPDDGPRCKHEQGGPKEHEQGGPKEIVYGGRPSKGMTPADEAFVFSPHGDVPGKGHEAAYASTAGGMSTLTRFLAKTTR